MKDLINILVVDDSSVVRDFLVYILSSEPDMNVVGTASNGKKAVEFVMNKKPDLITMDIEMPVMNGLEATREIMSIAPVPIIIVTSSYNQNEVEKTFNAIDAGALAILAKPNGIGHPDFEEDRKKLISTIRIMSEVKLVTRRSKFKKVVQNPIVVKPNSNIDENKVLYRIIAIGVSTGGPQVLQKILSDLPSNFRIPILIVQHIPPGFLEGMVEWLNECSQLEIRIAKNMEDLKPGKVYFCPPEYHIAIDSKMRVTLKNEALGYNIKPSVSHMFRSVGKNIKDKAVGILLTGMGKDGSDELAMIKERGGLTIAQDEESSVVYGMPGEAARIGACKYIMSPDKIVEKLIQLNR